MRWIPSLAILLSLFGTTTAYAEDPLLASIDAMMRDGQCASALSLLDYAQGSRASLMGRRALCEATLGRTEYVAVHVAEALRSPDDPWVIAHRSELVAALEPARAQPAARATATLPAPPPARAERAEAAVIANPYYYAAADVPTQVTHVRADAPPVPLAYLPLVIVNPYYFCE